MRIWLITVGEPLPTDGPNERFHRCGILAQTLAASGHQVVWWSSDFDHVRKKHRFDRIQREQVTPNLSLILLHGCGYQRNVSLDRLKDHRTMAEQFAQMADAEPRPDIIVSSLPTLELCEEAVRYGRRLGVPVLLDIRDLWPDVFEEVLPGWLRPVGKVVFRSFRRIAREACRDATGLIGITEPFLEWGLHHAGRARQESDGVFAHGYQKQHFTPEEWAEGLAFWQALGIGDKGFFTLCFFGAFGRQFDLATVIKAGAQLDAAGYGEKVRIILCGAGDNLNAYKAMAQGVSTVMLPGWVNAVQIATLMSLSQAGLAPYRNLPNFVGNLPNKPIEYMSAGLPIFSCLHGHLQKILADKGLGFMYDEGKPESLVALIRQHMDNRQALEPCSRRALDCFTEKYDAKRVYQDYEAHLVRVIALHRKTG
ncbi:MAG: glycosyltransferase family 4 protein [Magnetococcales bacterium]|nr:glycosyltransferase family 4 protein [Magnetococcales bacterium]